MILQQVRTITPQSILGPLLKCVLTYDKSNINVNAD